MKIIGYDVIEQVSKDALKKEVKKRIKEGWQLQGGASASLHQQSPSNNVLEVGYIQTMVKYKY